MDVDFSLIVKLASDAIPLVADYIRAENIRRKKYPSRQQLENEQTYGWLSRRTKAERLRQYEVNEDRLDPENF